MTQVALKIHPIEVVVAEPRHVIFAEAVSNLIEQAAKEPHTGLALRSPQYLSEKISRGRAVIALDNYGRLAGFCYLETWQHEKYVAHSGLIVAPQHRNSGLAFEIKHRIFVLSKQLFPEAKIFGLTTSKAVMHINSELGYKPTSFRELTTDQEFWAGCKSCPYFDILERTERRNCLCTAMLYRPNQKSE